MHASFIHAQTYYLHKLPTPVNRDQRMSAYSAYHGPKEEGCCLLYHPRDHDYLSDLACFVRAQLEVFVAAPSDLLGRTERACARDNIAVGSVGIRCVHCSPRHLAFVLPTGEKREAGASAFPGTIRAIYLAVRNWQIRHFQHCRGVPEAVRILFQRVKATGGDAARVKKKQGGNAQKYYLDSCHLMGMIDTEGGIRMQEGAFLERYHSGVNVQRGANAGDTQVNGTSAILERATNTGAISERANPSVLGNELALNSEYEPLPFDVYEPLPFDVGTQANDMGVAPSLSLLAQAVDKLLKITSEGDQQVVVAENGNSCVTIEGDASNDEKPAAAAARIYADDLWCA